MPERAPARPKVVAPEVVAPVVAPPPPPPKEEENWDLDFSSADTQPNGAYGIEIHHEGDVFSEIAEHAAILYANGQDDGARAALEAGVQGNREPGALRLWAMLFDLLRLKGDRAAFDALGLEFANLCELSPPSWTVEPVKRQAPKKSAAGVAALQGVLSAEDPVFASLDGAVAGGQNRRLELGRLAGLDGAAAARLGGLLRKARQQGLLWLLTEADGLAGRLEKRVAVGQQQEESLWLLLLELYQYLGWENQFEDKAVDYAVTFEVSPPSWDPRFAQQIQAALQQAEQSAEPEADPDPAETGFCFAGEILQGNLHGLGAYLQPGKDVLLDFSRVSRLDFVSAGALVNLLQTAGAGPVVIYHPNRLVAELMHVMGIDNVARVEISRY